MSENQHRAVRERAQKISPIWFVPIVAAIIGLWMLWHGYATRGPVITITMETAEGVEAGKTLIRAREVAVGKVETVQLSDAFDHIVVTARMNPDAQRMLRQDTQFWVVKPRIGREGISGLNTVLSGAYIELLPGRATDSRQVFTALEQPPATPRDAEGLRLSLVGSQAEAANVGDPVSFRGFEVGRVESATFDIDTRRMQYRLYIKAPFGRLVTANTRFWSRSGIKLSLNSEGITVDMTSLEGLLSGGIAFGVPSGLAQGDPVDENSSFVLHRDEEAARQGTFNRHLAYVLFIDDTVRGLSAGAPVEYRGVRVGTVVEAPFHFSHQAIDSLERAAIPVLIHIEPQRLEAEGTALDDAIWRERFKKLFAQGLRASLTAGNLLTGALLVDLDFYPKLTAPVDLRNFNGIREFPTVRSGFAQLAQKLGHVLDKLNELQIEPVLASLDEGLSSSRTALNQFEATARNLDDLLGDPETRALPAALRQSLLELQQTLDGFSTDAPAYRDLSATLKRLDKLMRDLQPLVRTLDERPNALIFDRRQRHDPEPRAKR